MIDEVIKRLRENFIHQPFNYSDLSPNSVKNNLDSSNRNFELLYECCNEVKNNLQVIYENKNEIKNKVNSIKDKFQTISNTIQNLTSFDDNVHTFIQSIVNNRVLLFFTLLSDNTVSGQQVEEIVDDNNNDTSWQQQVASLEEYKDDVLLTIDYQNNKLRYLAFDLIPVTKNQYRASLNDVRKPFFFLPHTRITHTSPSSNIQYVYVPSRFSVFRIYTRYRRDFVIPPNTTSLQEFYVYCYDNNNPNGMLPFYWNLVDLEIEQNNSNYSVDDLRPVSYGFVTDDDVRTNYVPVRPDLKPLLTISVITFQPDDIVPLVKKITCKTRILYTDGTIIKTTVESEGYKTNFIRFLNPSPVTIERLL